MNFKNTVTKDDDIELIKLIEVDKHNKESIKKIMRAGYKNRIAIYGWFGVRKNIILNGQYNKPSLPLAGTEFGKTVFDHHYEGQIENIKIPASEFSESHRSIIEAKYYETLEIYFCSNLNSSERCLLAKGRDYNLTSAEQGKKLLLNVSDFLNKALKAYNDLYNRCNIKDTKSIAHQRTTMLKQEMLMMNVANFYRNHYFEIKKSIPVENISAYSSKNYERLNADSIWAIQNSGEAIIEYLEPSSEENSFKCLLNQVTFTINDLYVSKQEIGKKDTFENGTEMSKQSKNERETEWKRMANEFWEKDNDHSLLKPDVAKKVYHEYIKKFSYTGTIGTINRIIRVPPDVLKKRQKKNICKPKNF